MQLRLRESTSSTAAKTFETAPAGPIELLIIQATPFCNINCRYCYLPDRSNKARISMETLAALARRVSDAGFLLAETLPVSWHAGEPTCLPVSFYERAFETLRCGVDARTRIRHTIQTNATLLSDVWLAFIEREEINLGLSLDGPAFLHDRSRVRRSGEPTHARVMSAVSRLQERGIPFGVIAVVTRETIGHPDAFYDFFAEHAIPRVAMNVEEVELHHAFSSMSTSTVDAYRAFLNRLFYRSLRDRSVQFRELTGVHGMVASDSNMPHRFSQLMRPFGVVSCDHIGNISSFSPELLGAKSDRYDDFTVGNVHRDSFSEMLQTRAMQAMLNDIQRGVDRCQRECHYFKLCGGGTPANKVFENGCFDTTETVYCRHSRMTVIDAALEQLERSVAARAGA